MTTDNEIYRLIQWPQTAFIHDICAYNHDFLAFLAAPIPNYGHIPNNKVDFIHRSESSFSKVWARFVQIRFSPDSKMKPPD